jgi:hypothetical protein
VARGGGGGGGLKEAWNGRGMGWSIMGGGRKAVNGVGQIYHVYDPSQ